MSMTNYQEIRVIQHELGISSMLFPTIFWIGLLAAEPTEAGAGTEPSGNGYARVMMTAPACWNAPTVGEPTSVTNAVEVKFPTPTGDWNEQTYFGVWDQQNGGNLLRYGPLDAPISPKAGDNPYFAAGDLELTLR